MGYVEFLVLARQGFTVIIFKVSFVRLLIFCIWSTRDMIIFHNGITDYLPNMVLCNALGGE